MRLCPKCGSLAYFNSYFDSFMCNSCEHMWKEEKRDTKDLKTKSGFTFKRHISVSKEQVSLMAK